MLQFSTVALVFLVPGVTALHVSARTLVPTRWAKVQPFSAAALVIALLTRLRPLSTRAAVWNLLEGHWSLQTVVMASVLPRIFPRRNAMPWLMT